MIGRSFSGDPKLVDVRLSLRRASLRDGAASTVLSNSKSQVVTLDGLDNTATRAKRFEIDDGAFFWWAQFEIRIPDTISPGGPGNRWGLLGVSLRRESGAGKA